MADQFEKRESLRSTIRHAQQFAPDPLTGSLQQEPRKFDGPTIHDGALLPPGGCPRKLRDCTPLSRVASPDFESFMCCGQTDAAPVPTDRLRLCVLARHKTGVDVQFNLDERDATDIGYVLLGGLSVFAQDRANGVIP